MSYPAVARSHLFEERDLYPTRQAENEAILERPDPAVFGDAPTGRHALTPEQVASYEKNGFLLLPDLFSKAEVDRFLREYARLAESSELKGRDELVPEPDSAEPRSIFHLQRFSPLFAKLSRDRRILDKVTQLLADDVYLFQSRINIKRGYHGRSFPWHSDFETWHAEDGLPRCRVLTAWIMLTENHEFNGPLYLIPGSHKRFVACAGGTPDAHYKESLRRQMRGVPSLDALEKLLGDERAMAAAHGSPGTLVIHEGNIMHGSPDNISPDPRTNLFFVYNSMENRPAPAPFAAREFRPAFLAERDLTPLKPADNEFV